MYLLKLALRPWRLAPMSQIFTGVAVGILFLMVGFLFWMQQGLKPVLTRLQGEQVITAYLGGDVDPVQTLKIVDTIRMTVGAHENNAEIKMVDSPEFMSQLKLQYPDLGRELEDLGSESLTVVPRFVSVSGILPDSALNQIRAVPGIESAESSKDRYKYVEGAFRALRWVARLLMGGLALALLTGLVHLARMNSYLHKDALSLLKLWGANDFTLRVPGMLSGLMVGLIGGVIAFLGWMSGGAWLARQIKSLSPILREMPNASPALGLTLLFGAILMGFIAGALSSSSLVTQERRI